MGKGDVLQHCQGRSHQEIAKAQATQTKLKFDASTSGEALKRTEAEVKMAVLTASSNVPFSFHDRLSPTIRAVFPDSKVASGYHSASTKAMCMINLAVAAVLIQDLLESMKAYPFSLSFFPVYRWLK